MKSLLLLLLSSSVISVQLTSLYSLRDDWSAHSTPNATYCYSEYSCVDCTTARVCAPTADGQRLHEITRFTCPSSYPWCNLDTGTCSNSMSADCYKPSAFNFTCMRDGHFPDPFNCSVYYHCKDGLAYDFACVATAQPYYSYESQTCVDYNYRCGNTTRSVCSSNVGRKVSLGNWATNSLFFYCLDNSTVLYDRCVGAYQFSNDYQMCVQACPHAGLFPRDDDCANYYRCSPASRNPNDSRYTITNLTCPDYQGFLESAYECVNRTYVPNCRVPYPDMFSRR